MHALLLSFCRYFAKIADSRGAMSLFLVKCQVKKFLSAASLQGACAEAPFCVTMTVVIEFHSRALNAFELTCAYDAILPSCRTKTAMALAARARRWAPIDRSIRRRSLLQQSLHLNLHQKRSQKQKRFPHKLLSLAEIFQKCSSVDCSSQEEIFLRPQKKKKIFAAANFPAWRTIEKGVAELSKRGRPWRAVAGQH